MISNLRSSVESYLNRNSSQIILRTAIVLGVSLLVGLSCLAYKVFSILFAPIISLSIVLFLLHRLVFTICRVLTFPGSTWYWRRNIENYFQKAFVTRINKNVRILRTMVEYLLEERLWNNYCNEEEMSQIKRVIASTLHIFHKQLHHRTLNYKQKEVMDYFLDIEHLLNEVKVKNRADYRSFTLWNFLDGGDEVHQSLELNRSIIFFEDKNQGIYLLNKCANLETRLHNITSKKKMYANVKRWFYEEIFGTLDQLREELTSRYKCKPIFLKVDHAVLDCMLISGHYPESSSEEDLDRKAHGMDGEPSRESLSDGTMIICCPNAGYYEYMFYENEWIEMYLRNGLNVFLWNYRGYGRSTGSPNPDSFRRDGDAIVDYLRNELNMKRIGVHGESLGGLVTAHIGRTKNIDFMCADRTFASLYKVAEVSFGRILSKLFRFGTLWDDQLTRDYLESRCFKVITYDPKDEIIPLLSSLKFGVTSQMIQKKLGYRGPGPRINYKREYGYLSPFRFIHMANELKRVIKLEYNQYKIGNLLNEYNDLLTHNQMLALYWAFHRISELFVTLSSINAMTVRRKAKRPKSTNTLPQNRLNMVKVPQPGKVSGASLDSSMDTSMARTDENTQGPLNKTQDESISFVNDSKMLNEAETSKALDSYDERDLLETTVRKSYVEAFNEEAQSSEKVIDLLVKIFAIFEDLEAGGIYVSDIMSLREEHRYQAFQHFIHCFEVWGSYYPLLKVAEDEACGITYYQNNAISKLKEFIRKTDKAITKQKQKQSTRSLDRLSTYVLEDLELISAIMPCLYQKLVLKLNKPSHAFVESAPSSSQYKQKGIELELENHKETKNNLRTSIAYSDTEAGPLDKWSLGNLIPLTCGHNGTPRPHELQLFEYLFRQSNMVK